MGGGTRQLADHYYLVLLGTTVLAKALGRVVRKPVNVNPGLNVI